MDDLEMRMDLFQLDIIEYIMSKSKTYNITIPQCITVVSRLYDSLCGDADREDIVLSRDIKHPCCVDCDELNVGLLQNTCYVSIMRIINPKEFYCCMHTKFNKIGE